MINIIEVLKNQKLFPTYTYDGVITDSLVTVLRFKFFDKLNGHDVDNDFYKKLIVDVGEPELWEFDLTKNIFNEYDFELFADLTEKEKLDIKIEMYSNDGVVWNSEKLTLNFADTLFGESKNHFKEIDKKIGVLPDLKTENKDNLVSAVNEVNKKSTENLDKKINYPNIGEVGQLLAVKEVDSEGRPTEFACVYPETDPEEIEIIHKAFKIWGKNAPDSGSSVSEGDVVATSEGYTDKNGNLQKTSMFSTTNLIEIGENTEIYAYNLYDFGAGYAITFFDRAKKVISGIGGTGNTEERITGYQEVPDEAKYIIVNLLNEDPETYCGVFTEFILDKVNFGQKVAFLESDVKKLSDELNDKKAEINEFSTETKVFDFEDIHGFSSSGYYNLNGAFDFSNKWKCSDYISVSPGDKITAKLTTYNTVSAISYFDKGYKYIGGIVGDTWSLDTAVYPINSTYEVPENAFFVRVSVLIADYAQEQFFEVNRSSLKALRNDFDIIFKPEAKLLVIGDSYSAQGRWIEYMKQVIDIKSIVNLAVSSASLKDISNDRQLFPYSDRPDKSDGKGNTNTFACQIQKLKRLIKGEDLDETEKPVYQSEEDYPNIVIIEGGMSDAPDSDEIVETYHDQFLVPKVAFYKQNASATTKETTVWVKPELETVDRTCFAGAYRYLCEEIINLFPDAQIFITTASHMNYFDVNPNTRYGKIAEQQRKCADIMSYSVIDWHAEGNLNTMMIGLNGSGTENDPYTPIGGDKYTTDLLHPNNEGAKRYGRLAGKTIVQKFLKLN